MTDREPTEAPFSSNAIRLTGRQWLATGAIVLAVCLLVSPVWRLVEPFEPGADYRIPYALNSDYWHFARYCRDAAGDDRILVVGDSVIWGEYVRPQDTLSHHLNRLAGDERFANLGVNGTHPAALDGLVRYYARAAAGRRVLIHFNPLWMSSPRRDLQAQKESQFNHPELVPQFMPRIPCYKAPFAERMGIAVERHLPFRAWINHMNVAYFDDMDLANWAIENPYANPLSRITCETPAPTEDARHENTPWNERGIKATEFDWVAPVDSLQWRLFCDTLATLVARGCHVFVLVGPFNEHMLTPEGREAYEAIKSDIAARLSENTSLYEVLPPLPSELYGDASHPLPDGYAQMASHLYAQDSFSRFAAGES
ncbi:MAG: hypothetical protein JXR94_05545 [Candidatus Hydrogenedentes bacterium]|nr:hypothetical protein [Candidatus Hydrogenedentota bacterium]